MPHPRRRFRFSPRRGFTCRRSRISLGLVDLSRTPSGTFFREAHPGSEMASQNDQNKANMITETFKPRRIVAIRKLGRCGSCGPTHFSELRRASWLSSDAAFGAGWSTFTPRVARACVARIDRRVTGDMRRRRRESHGWRGLARSGRVVGPREGDGSLIDSRLGTPSTVRPWARGFCPHGRPGPLGFGLCGRLPRHGVGGFMFNSSSLIPGWLRLRR